MNSNTSSQGRAQRMPPSVLTAIHSMSVDARTAQSILHPSLSPPTPGGGGDDSGSGSGGNSNGNGNGNGAEGEPESPMNLYTSKFNNFYQKRLQLKAEGHLRNLANTVLDLSVRLHHERVGGAAHGTTPSPLHHQSPANAAAGALPTNVTRAAHAMLLRDMLYCPVASAGTPPAAAAGGGASSAGDTVPVDQLMSVRSVLGGDTLLTSGMGTVHSGPMLLRSHNGGALTHFISSVITEPFMGSSGSFTNTASQNTVSSMAGTLTVPLMSTAGSSLETTTNIRMSATQLPILTPALTPSPLFGSVTDGERSFNQPPRQRRDTAPAPPESVGSADPHTGNSNSGSTLLASASTQATRELLASATTTREGEEPAADSAADGPRARAAPEAADHHHVSAQPLPLQPSADAPRGESDASGVGAVQKVSSITSSNGSATRRAEDAARTAASGGGGGGNKWGSGNRLHRNASGVSSPSGLPFAPPSSSSARRASETSTSPTAPNILSLVLEHRRRVQSHVDSLMQANPYYSRFSPATFADTTSNTLLNTNHTAFESYYYPSDDERQGYEDGKSAGATHNGNLTCGNSLYNATFSDGCFNFSPATTTAESKESASVQSRQQSEAAPFLLAPDAALNRNNSSCATSAVTEPTGGPPPPSAALHHGTTTVSPLDINGQQQQQQQQQDEQQYHRRHEDHAGETPAGDAPTPCQEEPLMLAEPLPPPPHGHAVGDGSVTESSASPMGGARQSTCAPSNASGGSPVFFTERSDFLHHIVPHQPRPAEECTNPVDDTATAAAAAASATETATGAPAPTTPPDPPHPENASLTSHSKSVASPSDDGTIRVHSEGSNSPASNAALSQSPGSIRRFTNSEAEAALLVDAPPVASSAPLETPAQLPDTPAAPASAPPTVATEQPHHQPREAQQPRSLPEPDTRRDFLHYESLAAYCNQRDKQGSSYF